MDLEGEKSLEVSYVSLFLYLQSLKSFWKVFLEIQGWTGVTTATILKTAAVAGPEMKIAAKPQQLLR